MNVSIAVFDVGVCVNVHPTFAHIFMLCAMVLVARLLCTGEGGSFMHLCCGSIWRGIPHKVRTVFPDPML